MADPARVNLYQKWVDDTKPMVQQKAAPPPGKEAEGIGEDELSKMWVDLEANKKLACSKQPDACELLMTQFADAVAKGKSEKDGEKRATLFKIALHTFEKLEKALEPDLTKLKAMKNPVDRRAISEAYLKKKQGNKDATTAELETIWTDAYMEHNNAEAEKIYIEQVKAKAQKDRPWEKAQNLEGKKPLQNLEDSNLVLRDLTDHTGNKLSEAQVLAIRIFSAQNYKYINSAVLREIAKDLMDKQNKPSDPAKHADYEAKTKPTLLAEGSLHAGMMKKAVEKLPPVKGTIYRGDRMNQARFDREFGKGFIEYGTFSSTSTDLKRARDFADGIGDNNNPPADDAVISVFCEANVVDARDIGKLSCYPIEKELLLCPGTILEIVEKTEGPVQTEGRPPAKQCWHIKLKQVLPDVAVEWKNAKLKKS